MALLAGLSPLGTLALQGAGTDLQVAGTVLLLWCRGLTLTQMEVLILTHIVPHANKRQQGRVVSSSHAHAHVPQRLPTRRPIAPFGIAGEGTICIVMGAMPGETVRAPTLWYAGAPSAMAAAVGLCGRPLHRPGAAGHEAGDLAALAGALPGLTVSPSNMAGWGGGGGRGEEGRVGKQPQRAPKR